MARQNFIGLVVSQGKMVKTVKVRVQTNTYDKVIHKTILKRKDYLVHDEGNLCREGDIVRIEAIPKISPRKYFAIAEIKVNKGVQFEKYESLAKQKVAQEEKLAMKEIVDRRNELQSVITKVEDLKLLDNITRQYQSAPDDDNQHLIEQINEIKKKYDIKSWPSYEPILNLELAQTAKDLTTIENRKTHIHRILNALLSDEYKQKRIEILTKVSKKDIESLKPNIQKNLLRKYVLDPRNDIPVSF